MEEFCPRLVDYLVFVGSHAARRNSISVQTPTVLNRFPPCDHKDFVLPPDVALFCQPEGCYRMVGSSASKLGNGSLPRTPYSFVFTLTDKESSKIRYGICLNFFRPLHRNVESPEVAESVVKVTNQDKYLDSVADVPTYKADSFPDRSVDLVGSEPGCKRISHFSQRLQTYTLTSLCLVTHHPFISKFRSLLEFLLVLIQKLHEKSRSKLSVRDSVWGVLTGATRNVNSSLVTQSIRELEIWILRLLSAPAPIPGRTCVHLFVQPKALMKPLVFALPDKTRLPLADYSLSLPIQLLGISRTLRILVCLLLEQKVVLQSSDHSKVSICVLAFTALLYPLQYMFPIIPLLPPCMPDAEQLLIAPTPYIIGVPASFYTARKVFRMPKDVWVANLDTQELSYPEVIEEIPDLPEPECSNLVRQLNWTLSALKIMNSLPQPREDISLDVVTSEMNRLIQSSSIVHLADYNPLTYITDEASARVAMRVSMILFLQSKNILADLPVYTRALRLYPRPVVAFQFESFMKSRPRPCLFTSMLSRSQAVEYFAESSLCAQNEAYQRIQAGEYAAELIGDKSQWFDSLLTPVHFDVWLESVAGLPSGLTSHSEFSVSPLLHALVAARLHPRSSRYSVDNEGLFGKRFESNVVADEASDYPTDESASDAETERSTTSLASFLSDPASDYVDSGIGETHHKGDREPTESMDVIESGDSKLMKESIAVYAGVALPPSLSSFFSPPTVAVDPPSKIKLNVDDDLISPEDLPSRDSELITDETLNEASAESTTGGVSTSQALRRLTRLSMTAFNSNPSSKLSESDRSDARIISDGRINWGSPFFILISELFNPRDAQTEESGRSNLFERHLKKRLEDERYVIQLAKFIKSGNIPSIFSRSRVTSVLESESGRNLLLSRLNQCDMNIAFSDAYQNQVEDVAIDNWNQYKAMVWIFRKIISSLESSLRSDILIPMPSNVHTNAESPHSYSPTGTVNTQDGLASSFGLLEIAHTHYFPLPQRLDRRFRNSVQVIGSLSPQSPPPSPLSSSVMNVEGLPPSPLTTSGESSHGGREGISQPQTLTSSIHREQTSTTNPSLHSLNTDAKCHESKTRIQSDLTRQPSFSGPIGTDYSNELTNSSPKSHVEGLPVLQPFNYYPGTVGETTLLPKSSRSRGYRYHCSKLVRTGFPVSPDGTSPLTSESRHSFAGIPMNWTVGEASKVTGMKNTKPSRTYLFEDLVSGSDVRSKLWDNMQFWEDAFLDTVAQERDIQGMDFRPVELLARYGKASSLKRKHAELEEDRLLAGLMHNVVAFMIMMEVDRVDIRKKIRRLLAKSHMGLHYSQEISNLLDSLEFLSGNDVDLKPVQSRAIPHRSYDVRRGSTSNGDLLFIEVCDDFLLLRSLSGVLLERWWYDQLINVSYRSHTHVLCISVRISEQSKVHVFHTQKCQLLYQEIQRAMKHVSFQIHRGLLAPTPSSYPHP